MEIPHTQWVMELLDRDDEVNCSIEEMADRIINLFSSAESVFKPIIGLRGLAALYDANLKRFSSNYPWLCAAIEHPCVTLNLQLLRSVLLDNNHQTLMQAGAALITNFYLIIAGLIGSSLTEQLLRPVWAPTTVKPAREI